MTTTFDADDESFHIDIESFWRDQGFDAIEGAWLEATWAILEAERARLSEPASMDVRFDLISDE